MDRITLQVGDAKSPPEAYKNVRARLIYLDPPSNIGHNPHGSLDRVPEATYYSSFIEIVRASEKLASGNAWFVVFVHFNRRYFIEKILRRSLMYFKFFQEVVWYHGFGRYCRSKFVNDHYTILIFRRGKPKFYWEETAIESVRQKMRDNRADPRGRTLGTVWRIPRIPGTAKIREHLGTDIKRSMQPWELVFNIVCSLTKKDETVYDPCAGSGIVAKICEVYGRRYYGLDICDKYVKQAKVFLDWRWDMFEEFQREVK